MVAAEGIHFPRRQTAALLLPTAGSIGYFPHSVLQIRRQFSHAKRIGNPQQRLRGDVEWSLYPLLCLSY